MPSNDQAFHDAILRTNFEPFLRRCFMTLNPGVPYLPNWHIRAITHQLDRVQRGEVTRLIINLPPRTLKSLIVSVAFPAFLLGHDPSRRIFALSYGSDLSLKHASDFRSIVQSSWYHRAFPQFRIARDTEQGVTTTRRGFRNATSVYGTLTGLGGDLFIIDDPQKPVDAQSQTNRDSLNKWFSNTLISRLDSKQRGIIIVVMQRVHLDDLSGYLAEGGGWELLSLPAIAEAEEHVLIGDNEYHRRRAGQPLHPTRDSIATLRQLQRQIGSDVFAAQYQQCPVPPGGAMIKRDWLRYYDVLPRRTYRTKVIQSWDTAAKDGAQNDWSVCTTWFISENVFYLLDLTRGRYEYPQLRTVALSLADRFKPDTILIEDASTGMALAQELKHTHRLAVKCVPVEHDKTGRLYVQQAKFEAGLVLFPRGASFLAELEAELLSFPHGRTDDQVDSISQALAHQVSGYDTTMSWVG